MMYSVQVSIEPPPTPSPVPAPPTHGHGTHIMLAGDRLYPNDYLISQNGLWKLKYQTDGNLKLYNADESVFYWESGTVNSDSGASNECQAAGYLSLQADGNLLMVGKGT